MKRRGKKIISMVLAVIMALSMFNYSGHPEKTVEAAGSFPVSGVHKGTLTHGSYMRLSGLKASTGATVIEADDMTSGGARRTAFCLSPGVSETGKENAYTSADFTSGYGIKYYKALMAFYYDHVNEYRTNAARFATQLFVWRTVILERNHSGNFAASAYDGNGFKEGFISSMKSLVGFDDAKAEMVYNTALGYIKEGAKGTYNNKVALLKWTANASQTMLTGNVYSDKTVKIKIDKNLDIKNSGLSLAGTKYEIHEDSKNGKKVGTFVLDRHGVDTITLSRDGNYDGSVKYYLYETVNVSGTTSNAGNAPAEFTIDWGKIKDGAGGGTLSLTKDGVKGSKPSWLVTMGNLAKLCLQQLEDHIPYVDVTVVKEETGTAKKLKGAEFTIYAYNNDTGRYDTKVSEKNNLGHAVTNPITTGSDGTVTSDSLYYTAGNLGRFKIVETKAPDGHINMKESKTFRIKSGKGVTSAEQPLSLTFDDPNDKLSDKYPVKLVKINRETGTPIYDAGFTIWTYKYTRKSDGKDFYYPYDGNIPSSIRDTMYFGDKAAIEQLKDKNGNKTNTYQTEMLETNRTYMIRETKRPKGYTTSGGSWGLGHGAGDTFKTLADYDGGDINYTLVFTLLKDGTIKIIDNYGSEVSRQGYAEPITVNNDLSEGSITVKKKDSVSNEPLSGATFELWEVTADNYDKDGYVPSDEKEATLTAKGETDAKGEFTFGRLVGEKDEFGDWYGDVYRENGVILSEHYYMLVETNAPEGYRLPEDNIQKIHVGAKEAKYTVNSMENAFEKTYEIGNEKATLDLNIHKVSVSRTGKESVALKGAEFALYRVDEIVSDGDSDVGADDAVGSNIDYSRLTNENYIDFDYSTVTPISDNIVTDDNGNATVPKILEAGGYVLVETKAPKNYLKSEPQYIYIDRNTLDNSVPFEIEVRDKEFEARVHAVKKDATTGEVVKQAGVGFKVKNLDTGEYVKQTVDYYVEPEIEGAPHELIKSEVTDTFYTDENGEVLLPNVLSCGHYQLEEIVPPKGYLLNDTPVKFTVDDEEDYYPDDPNKQFDYDENTRDVVINITFSDKPTETYLTKKDRNTGELISGGKFHVEDMDGNIIESWDGTGEAHLIKKLEQGVDYMYVEDEAPEGYVRGESVKFRLSDTENVTHIEMLDECITVEISKQAVASSDELPGAHLYLYMIKDGEETLYDSWISTTTPHVIKRIPAGKYRLVEETAPLSYVVAESITFDVEEKTEIQTVVMKDDHAGSITIKKKDGTGNIISGARFKLEGADGSILYGDTDETGSVTFGKDKDGNNTLMPQKYVLTEEKTKDGHTLLKEPVEINIPMQLTKEEADGRNADLSKAVWDEETKTYRFYELTYEIVNDTNLTAPDTGGDNGHSAAVAGGMMCLLSLSLYGLYRRKKSEEA